jgi:hypothetical protein
MEKKLNAFEKNVEMAHAIKDRFPGNYVAIYDQKVVGHDTEHNNLWAKIVPYISEKQLYVSYIPEEDEVLVV